MDSQIHIKPLPYKTRRRTFGFLMFLFILALPILYIYATGYRFDFDKPTNLVSTGGMYVAVPIVGADIYIDDELVRETRTFRKAFYAQNLDVGTHRVHVQKDGYHTWVKELPVSKHRVTEAEAFSLPLVPQVRVIGKYVSATGTMIIREPLAHASSTNELYATSTVIKKGPFAFVENDEFKTLITHFATTSTTTKGESTTQHLRDLLTKSSTTTEAVSQATTTIISNGVKLYEHDGDVFATWIGSFEDMPYYYCAPEFPSYSTSTSQIATSSDLVPSKSVDEDGLELGEEKGMMSHPVQTLSKDIVCEPTIRIDRKYQTVHGFNFFLGSTDFALMLLDDGVYVVEIDDRSWQNVQPLFMGKNLHMYIENGVVYVYDGEVIYQIIIATE